MWRSENCSRSQRASRCRLSLRNVSPLVGRAVYGSYRKDVTLYGDEHIGRIRSSDWAERGFCNKCGSNLYYHIIDSAEYQISAGVFDHQSLLQMLSLQVVTDSKPHYYEFSNKTKMMTAADVLAEFAPPKD